MAGEKAKEQTIKQSIVDLFEVFLGNTALGAGPVVGQGFEGSAGLDAAVGIAEGGVVDVATDGAAPFAHGSVLPGWG